MYKDNDIQTATSTKDKIQRPQSLKCRSIGECCWNSHHFVACDKIFMRSWTLKETICVCIIRHQHRDRQHSINVASVHHLKTCISTSVCSFIISLVVQRDEGGH